tara:strand:- start:187 stop:327 length:141 start_codon:yes stop_codon:yes gene_type:complete
VKEKERSVLSEVLCGFWLTFGERESEAKVRQEIERVANFVFKPLEE